MIERVAGVYAPALVERDTGCRHSCARARGVAGVYAPALVERFHGQRQHPENHVSPGFTPRPWLSVEQGRIEDGGEGCRRGLRPGLG